jgi:CHRD domain-containing protein
MKGKAILALAATCCLVLVTAPAQSATKAQIGAKCRAAWTGSTSTAAFRAFRAGCIKAATAAISDATDAGNPTSTTANTARSRRACGRQFPHHASGPGRKAFTACVKASNAAQRAFAGRPLRATLKSSNEVPAPSVGGATGTALVRLNQGKHRVCVTLTLKNFPGQPFLAHIHKGAPGVAGPPVVDLGTPALLAALAAHKPGRACVTAAVSDIKDIRQHPGQYYVNIHTSTDPNGAARGQLHK